MARTKDTVKDLRGALNAILGLVETVLPNPHGGNVSDHETPEYILNRIRVLVHRYREAKELQDKAVDLFKSLNEIAHYSR